MVKVGDSVSWFVKEGGQQSGLVTEVTDQAVKVVTWTNQTKTVSLRSIRIVEDRRMKTLHELEIEDPVQADFQRQSYIEKYLTAAKEIEKLTEKHHEPKPPKVEIVSPEDQDLTNRIIEVIIKSESPLSKSEIFSKLGEEVQAPKWAKITTSQTFTKSILKEGKTRGTKYRGK